MFYDTFEALCQKANIAPSTLAINLGMSRSAPGRWKNGSLPDLDTVIKIADHFGVTIDFLVKGEMSAQVNYINDAQNSVVMQGTRGNNTVYNTPAADSGLTEQERELLTIFRRLDRRSRLDIMDALYEQEDKMPV